MKNKLTALKKYLQASWNSLKQYEIIISKKVIEQPVQKIEHKKICHSCMETAIYLCIIVEQNNPDAIKFNFDLKAQMNFAECIHKSNWGKVGFMFGATFLKELIHIFSEVENYEVCAEIKKQNEMLFTITNQ